MRLDWKLIRTILAHVESETLDGYYSLSANPSLTLNGYFLLESLRTDNYIEKLKKYAKEKCVPLTIENVIELAKLALPTLLQ